MWFRKHGAFSSLLEPYLQWHDYGLKCTVRALLQVLFYAAGYLCSVFAACSQLRTALSDQAVRDALTALKQRDFITAGIWYVRSIGVCVRYGELARADSRVLKSLLEKLSNILPG
jgi:hypothetical protein